MTDSEDRAIGRLEAQVLLSNMNVSWPGTNATWWEGSGDLDGLTGGIALNRHQRVTLHADAAFAAIGVRGSSASAKLRALRLFCDALGAPRVLAGGNRAWGTREVSTSLAWSVPSLGAGVTATQDVTLAGVRQGDFVTAGHAKDSGFQNGGVVFHAVVGGTAATDQVRVTAQNLTGSTIVVGDGTLFVRAVRPRL
jgi:hypothetical protein